MDLLQLKHTHTHWAKSGTGLITFLNNLNLLILVLIQYVEFYSTTTQIQLDCGDFEGAG